MSRPKRAHHAGSITRRKDGRWEARLTLPDGRRRSLYGKTWGEAERKLMAARRELEKGIVPAEAAKMTVARFGEMWLDAQERRLRALTMENYRRRWRVNIVPTIGHVRLTALTPAHIQRVISEAQRAGYADATVATLRAIMVAAFEDAVRWRLLGHNPARDVRVPKGRSRELPELTRPQVAALLEGMRTHRYAAILLLGAGLGLRWSEARGLRWEDVDLERGVIRIRSSVRVRDGEVVFDGVKSRSSKRDLPLPAFLAEALRVQRREQLLRRMRSRQPWQELDLVNDGRAGRPVSSPAIGRALTAICETAGVPPLTFHHLRHLCATLLLMEGVPVKTTQAILGHASPRITMDIYMHLNRELLDDAADAMERIFRETGS